MINPVQITRTTAPESQPLSDHIRPANIDEKDVYIRRLPYPFRAMLAICSDLDGTPEGHVYFTMMKYLNTTEETLFGPGVGLEIGNTIYFDVSPPQFCYWNTNEAGRAKLRCLIQSGHVDCLHSFGSRATTRGDAARALEELDNHNCKLKVWVDHARVPTNFGSDVTFGHGDIIGSPAYHADLTLDYGINYVWRGRVTSVIGQDVQRSLRGIANKRHPWASCKTLLKEFLKGLYFSSRFAINRSNNLIREAHLRSGHPVLEFMRFNPHWGGVGAGATADGIPNVLTKNILDMLVKREGCSVLYTHLGRAVDPQKPFNPIIKNSFSLLAKYVSERKILVATTKRLLDYGTAIKRIQLSVSLEEDITKLKISRGKEDVHLDGITIYVPDTSKAEVFIDGQKVQNLERNPPDHTGRASVSLPWLKLDFPSI